MPTIKDIANLANVSVCTVSRYLNHKIVVKKETEDRLEAAIKELGYVPNMVAQSLKKNSTTNIAVILPRITSSYYSDMTGGISQELAKHGFNLFIYEVDNLQKTEAEILQVMRENMIAGVIFIGMSYDMSFKDSLQYLLDWKIPVVYVNRLLPHTNFPLVYPNFPKVGQLAAEHLIARGKRRLALVYKKLPDDLSLHHIEAFRDTIAASGLDCPVILSTQPGLIPSNECLERLLAGDIDGIFALNELIAAGLVKSLTQRGLHIPSDIAVLGFGNSIVGEITSPELSCVDLRNYELGLQSAKLILQQIDHLPTDPITVLDPFILQREST